MRIMPIQFLKYFLIPSSMLLLVMNNVFSEDLHVIGSRATSKSKSPMQDKVASWLDWASDSSSMLQYVVAMFAKGGMFGNAVRSMLDLPQTLIIPPVGLSTACREHMVAIWKALTQAIKEERSPMNEWAWQLLDSFGKPRAGLLKTNFYWPGDFYQCVDIDVDVNSTRGHLVGAHCIAVIPFPFMPPREYHFTKKMLNSSHFKFGTCFPKTCGTDDRSLMISVWTAILFGLDEAFRVQVSTECATKAGTPMDSVAIGLTVALLIPIAFVILATIYDYLDVHLLSRPGSSGQSDARDGDQLALYKIRERSLKKKLFLCFSARKCYMKLFDAPAEDPSFAFMYGLRSLSIFWVIFKHSVSFPDKLLLNMNFLDVYKMFDNLYMEIFNNATFAVETFFFLSGFCVVYFSLRRQQKQPEKCFNPLMQYLNRYMRLTPAVAAAVALTAGPLMSIANGPMWYASLHRFKKCRKNWWPDLLYFNNFVWGSESCMGSYWYLAVDMQLFLITPFVLFILSRRPKFGMVVIGLLFLSSVICRGVLIHLHHLRNVRYVNEPVDAALQYYNRNFYPAPWVRLCIYAQGMFVACYLHYTKKNITMKPLTVILGWTLCLILFIALVFGTYGYTGMVPMSLSLNFLHGTFTTPAWGLVVGWIVVACATGYGGLINSLLSLRIFVPIGRLSYCIYLVQELVIFTCNYSLLSFPALTGPTMMHDTVVMIVYSILVAIIFHMGFEAPASELWAVVQARLNCLSCMKKKKSPSSEKYSEQRENLLKDAEAISISIKGDPYDRVIVKRTVNSL